MKGNLVRSVLLILIVSTGARKKSETIRKLNADRELREQAEEYFTSDGRHTSFIKQETETIELDCNTDYLSEWQAIFPTGELKWLKNAKSFELDASRMLVEDRVLTISNLQTTDTGVYLCQWEFVLQVIRRKGLFGTKKKPILRSPSVGVFSIAVQSKRPQIHTRVGLNVELNCNGAVLGALLNQTNQRWYLNGKVVIDFKMTPPQDVENQTIPVKQGMAGEWQCVITHAPTMKYWITACFLMAVGPPLSIWEKMIRQPFYLICAILGACFVAAIPIMLLMGRFKKKEKEAQEQYKKIKSNLQKGKRISSSKGGNNLSDTETDDDDEDDETESSSEEVEEEEGGWFVEEKGYDDWSFPTGSAKNRYGDGNAMVDNIPMNVARPYSQHMGYSMHDTVHDSAPMGGEAVFYNNTELNVSPPIPYYENPDTTYRQNSFPVSAHSFMGEEDAFDNFAEYPNSVQNPYHEDTNATYGQSDGFHDTGNDIQQNTFRSSMQMTIAPPYGSYT